MNSSQQDIPFPPAVHAGPADVPPGHTWAAVEPSVAPELAFGLILPLGWVMEPDPNEKPKYPGHLARLALFGDTRQTPPSIVQVSYTRVEFDLHLYDWMGLSAKAFSMEPIDWRVYCGPSGREIVEMLGLTGPADNRHVARTLCLADSGFIIALLAMAPVQRYAELAETFALIAGSFALTRPAHPGQLEAWAAASTTSPDFRLAYPASWTQRVVQIPASIAGKSGIECVLVAENDLAGYVRVKAIDPKIVPDDPQRTLQLAFEELTEAGIKIESEWREDSDPLLAEIPGFIAGRRAVGRMTKGPLDLRVALVLRDGLNFCGTLLALSPDEFPAQWMRAKFAFLLALASASVGAS